MTELATGSPFNRKIFKAACVIVLLLLIGSMYLKFAQEHPPRWVDAPRPLIFVLGGAYFLFDPSVHYMRSTRYGLAALAFALAILNASILFL